MRTILVVWGLALSACSAVVWAGPSASQPAGLIGARHDQAARAALAGAWSADVGGQRIELQLTPGGEFSLTGRSGRFEVRGKTLALADDAQRIEYAFDLNDDVLTLSGGDLAGPTKFTRAASLDDYAGWLFHFSAESAKQKLLRIGTILAIVIGCRAAIWLFGLLSRLLVFSQWGPLRLIYRQSPARSRTIHLLILNAVKYSVYFVAAGFILSELGVNYKTYLASLSVIGLAIGFGSQGLVQDVVTGLFLILEGQFDVGDMVEISGQIGTVKEVGMRMTRLENYLGETVMIPNRNISLVGNFRAGAEVASVDVAVESSADAARAAALLEQAAREIGRQFKGVVLSAPRVEKETALATGERFVRVTLSIWPKQEWVVEAQLAPRVRELFAREKLTIPGDRIVTFYHAREQKQVSSWRDAFSRLRRRAGARTDEQKPDN